MIFEGLFDNWQDVERAFEIEPMKNVLPLFAAYEYEDYSGSAVALYVQNGNLFLVSGGHCSCNGLEGQWDPELLSWEIAETILEKTYYLDKFSDYVLPVVHELVISENRDEELSELIVVHSLKH